jgi:hypothetical protein
VISRPSDFFTTLVTPTVTDGSPASTRLSLFPEQEERLMAAAITQSVEAEEIIFLRRWFCMMLSACNWIFLSSCLPVSLRCRQLELF